MYRKGVRRWRKILLVSKVWQTVYINILNTPEQQTQKESYASIRDAEIEWKLAEKDLMKPQTSLN